MSKQRPGVEGNGELRIVMGVDGSSCATRALEYAAHRAADTGPVLIAVCAYGMIPPRTP